MQLSKMLADGTQATLRIGDHAPHAKDRIMLELSNSTEEPGPVAVEGVDALKELVLLIQQGLGSTLR